MLLLFIVLYFLEPENSICISKKNTNKKVKSSDLVCACHAFNLIKRRDIIILLCNILSKNDKNVEKETSLRITYKKTTLTLFLKNNITHFFIYNIYIIHINFINVFVVSLTKIAMCVYLL